MRSGPVVRGPGRLRHGNGLGSSNPLPISRLSSRGLGPERQRRGRRDAEPRCAHPSPPCSPHRQAASRSGRRQTYFLLALERCPCSPCGGVAFEISGRLRCRWLMSLRGKVRGQPVRARIPIQGWAYSSVRVVNGRDQNRLVCEFFFHLALLLSKRVRVGGTRAGARRSHGGGASEPTPPPSDPRTRVVVSGCVVL